MINRELVRLDERSAGASALQPAALFVVQSLLYPLAPVATLAASLAFWRIYPYGHYFVIAVLAFLGVADILDDAPLRRPATGALAWSALLDTTLRWLLLVGFIWGLMYAAGLSSIFDWRVMLSWTIATPAVIWAGGMIAPHAFSRSGAARKRAAVIVGASPIGFALANKLNDAQLLNIELHGFFDDRMTVRGAERAAPRLLGKMRDVSEYVARRNVDLVYITLPMTRQKRVLELLNSLRDSTTSIYFVPDLTVCELVQPRFDLVNGIPVVAVCESPFYGLRGVAKRLTDIVIAGALIALLSPVLIAVAIGVRLSSPGPVIFRQRRYGLDGREIVVYKFRSMRVTEDGEHTYAQVQRNDPRVTGFGAFIRASSLDELPQLFNVLEGGMSIVGPRPHAIAVNEQYRRLIPGYMVRHKVRPGITGWAQINGLRGGDDLDSMRRRITLDLEYLQHWSLSLDLLIMLKTALVVWKDRHAY